MTRLIDKDYLIEEIRCSPVGQLLIRKHNLDGMIEKFPEVDAEPVRHGKWIVEYEVKDGRSMRCSECQMVFWVGSGRDGNYCPNCGAKMDGDKHESY